MKKTIFTFISLLMLMNYGKAQQSSFGFQAGATFASYKLKVESVSVTSKTKAGFTVGVVADVAMGKSFSFQPALNFLQKGGVLKQSGATDKQTYSYLELPLNFVFGKPASTFPDHACGNVRRSRRGVTP